MNTMFLKLMIKVQNLLNNEEGQDLIEYGLLAGIVALVAISSLQGIGSKISSVFASIDTAL